MNPSPTFPQMHPGKAKRVARELNELCGLGSYQRTVQALAAGRYDVLARHTPRHNPHLTSSEPDTDLLTVATTLAERNNPLLNVSAFGAAALHEPVAAALRLRGVVAVALDIGVAAQTQNDPIVETVVARTEHGWELVEVNIGMTSPVGHPFDGSDLEEVADPSSLTEVVDACAAALESVASHFADIASDCFQCGLPAVLELDDGDRWCVCCDDEAGSL